VVGIPPFVLLVRRKELQKISDNPEVRVWHKIWIVKISDVGEEFAKWLNNQTMPLVEEDENSTNWAYFGDYSRFIHKLPIID